MSKEHKVAICGGGGVGKSALTIMLIQGDFDDEYDPTVEDSYKKQITVDHQNCFLDILDTAGQEEYSAMRAQYMRTCEAFLLVFAVSNKASFHELSTFHGQICKAKDGKNQIPMVVVANKCDLPEEEWEVTEDMYTEFADQIGAGCVTASAKENIRVEEAFQELVRLIRNPGGAGGAAVAASDGGKKKSNKKGGGTEMSAMGASASSHDAERYGGDMNKSRGGGDKSHGGGGGGGASNSLVMGLAAGLVLCGLIALIALILSAVALGKNGGSTDTVVPAPEPPTDPIPASTTTTTTTTGASTTTSSTTTGGTTGTPPPPPPTVDPLLPVGFTTVTKLTPHAVEFSVPNLETCYIDDAGRLVCLVNNRIHRCNDVACSLSHTSSSTDVPCLQAGDQITSFRPLSASSTGSVPTIVLMRDDTIRACACLDDLCAATLETQVFADTHPTLDYPSVSAVTLAADFRAGFFNVIAMFDVSVTENVLVNVTVNGSLVEVEQPVNTRTPSMHVYTCQTASLLLCELKDDTALPDVTGNGYAFVDMKVGGLGQYVSVCAITDDDQHLFRMYDLSLTGVNDTRVKYEVQLTGRNSSAAVTACLVNPPTTSRFTAVMITEFTSVDVHMYEFSPVGGSYVTNSVSSIGTFPGASITAGHSRDDVTMATMHSDGVSVFAVFASADAPISSPFVIKRVVNGISGTPGELKTLWNPYLRSPALLTRASSGGSSAVLVTCADRLCAI